MLLGKPIEPDELVAAVASLAGRPIPKDLATPRAS